MLLFSGSILICSTTIENENELNFKIGNYNAQFKIENNEVKLVTQNPSLNFVKFEKTSELNNFIEIFKEHSKATIFIVFLITLIILISALVVLSFTLKHLEQLFKNIYNGDTPFTLENVFHIKRMTYLMIAVTILPAFANAISNIILNRDLDFNIGTNLITILFLYSIAYIFEYGYQIQLDSNGRIYDNENE